MEIYIKSLNKKVSISVILIIKHMNNSEKNEFYSNTSNLEDELAYLIF